MPILSDRQIERRVTFAAYLFLLIDDDPDLSQREAYKRASGRMASPFSTFNAFEQFLTDNRQQTTAKKQEIYWEIESGASEGGMDIEAFVRLSLSDDDAASLRSHERAVRKREGREYRKRTRAARDEMIAECLADPAALARMVDSYLKLLAKL